MKNRKKKPLALLLAIATLWTALLLPLFSFGDSEDGGQGLGKRYV